MVTLKFDACLSPEINVCIIFEGANMYINGHLALLHCIHLINMKFVHSKKNCDQKNSLTSLSDFLF